MTERETIAGIVRNALEAGQTVEIDGLGTFRASAHGYEFAPQTRPEVFIAYVAEDLAAARRLCEALRAKGCAPWRAMNEVSKFPTPSWRALRRDRLEARAVSERTALCAGLRAQEAPTPSNFPDRCTVEPKLSSQRQTVGKLVFGTTRYKHRVYFSIIGDVVSVVHIRHGSRKAPGRL